MAKDTKRFIFMAILFSAVTITFSLLYYYRIITYLGLMLTVTYMSYFVGLALLYNGAYARNQQRVTSTKLNFAFGIIFILVSIALLVYGITVGEIILF